MSLSFYPSIFFLLTRYPFPPKNPEKNFSFSIWNLLTTSYIYNKNDMKEETKRKISYKLRGRKKGATHKKRIAQAMKRLVRSEEHNKAIAEAMRIIWKKRKEGTLCREGDTSCTWIG